MSKGRDVWPPLAHHSLLLTRYSSLAASGRDREAEPASPVQRALDGDVSAVRLDDAAHDREAEPGAAPLGGAGALPEAVEHVRQVLGRDPRAGVLDGEADAGRVAVGGERDAAAAGRELEGVGHQVGERLLEALGVGPNGG